MNKNFKIDPELLKRIRQVTKEKPKADVDLVYDEIVNKKPSLRMKNNAIKKGIEEYFEKQASETHNGNGNNNPKIIDITTQLESVKKKVKKADLPINFQDDESYKFENLGGISETLKQVQKYILEPFSDEEHFKEIGETQLNKGFLICGPMGSGKTMLGNCILSYLKNNYGFTAFAINCTSLISNDGEEKLRKIFEGCKENVPAVILFDEIDVISSKEGSKRPQGSLLPYLLNSLEKINKQRIIFISTTENPEKIDISMKKFGKFFKAINVNISTDKNREQILIKLLQKNKNNLKEQEISLLSKMTSSFMAADLVALLQQAKLLTWSKVKENKETFLKFEHFKSAIKFVQPMMKKEGFADKPDTTLEDVGGLQQIKKKLKRQIIFPILRRQQLKQMQTPIQNGGVLLYGPPGCGKTMLAKAIANAVQANFILVNGPQLLNKYVGESQQAVRQVFGRAKRASPCIIFFDQFDAIAPRRSDNGNEVTGRVVNTFLTCLDGVEERKMVFVIAATNRIDMIDAAILRSGRIQMQVKVPQPDQSQRNQILKAITRKKPVEESIDFQQIAEECEGFSGADLKMLINEATVNALENERKKILGEDIDTALMAIKRANEERQIQKLNTSRVRMFDKITAPLS